MLSPDEIVELSEEAFISDEDAHAIVAYLRTVEPVKKAIPRSDIRFPVSFFIEMVPEPLTAPVPAPDRGDEKAYGAYLATVAGCKPDDQSQGLLLARYPSMPLSFDRVCPGFRAVFLGADE